MTVALRPLTFDDLAATPDDGQRYELLNGEMYVTAAPTPNHQTLIYYLCLAIGSYLEPRRLGPLLPDPNVVLSEYDVVRPDLVWIAPPRRSQHDRHAISVVPDLVIEVLSPSTRRFDLIQKQALYAKAGISEYWIVDARARTVTVLQLTDARYLGEPSATAIASRVWPEFTLDVGALFDRLMHAEDD